MAGSDDSLLITAKQAADLCAVSLRTWRTWRAGAQAPRPVHIGRTLRWRRDDLNAWVAAGCPRERDWQPTQA